MQYPLYAGLNALPGRKDEEVALLDVPVDLLLLRADLRELKIDCSALIAVPEWLGELVHSRCCTWTDPTCAEFLVIAL